MKVGHTAVIFLAAGLCGVSQARTSGGASFEYTFPVQLPISSSDLPLDPASSQWTSEETRRSYVQLVTEGKVHANAAITGESETAFQHVDVPGTSVGADAGFYNFGGGAEAVASSTGGSKGNPDTDYYVSIGWDRSFTLAAGDSFRIRAHADPYVNNMVEVDTLVDSFQTALPGALSGALTLYDPSRSSSVKLGVTLDPTSIGADPVNLAYAAFSQSSGPDNILDLTFTNTGTHSWSGTLSLVGNAHGLLDANASTPPVPEPTTCAGLLAGLALLGAVRKRKTEKA